MEGPVQDKSAGSSWRALGLLLDRAWLKNTFILSRAFAPRCILPAVLLTVAGITTIVGRSLAFSQIQPEGTQIISIFAAIGIMLATLGIVLSTLISAFVLWLVRLSTFSHAFCALDVSARSAPGTIQMQEAFDTAHTYVVSRKKYFAQFYLMVTLVLLGPSLIWFGLFVTKILTMAPPNSGSMVPKLVLPPVADISINLLLTVLGAYFFGFSLMALVMSTMSRDEPNQAAWSTIKLSFKLFLPMIALAVVVALLNTVIATPQVLLHPKLMETTSGSLPLDVLSQVWEGLTSLMLFTLTVAPFCELLRNRLKDEFADSV